MSNFLKKLELNGFKSFAGKTTLEFPSGITAIVGPNGCGKSNIVDAIRWLLGEREARNLRGARAEDLIFAGTPKRPRVGLAQATLYFENKNKFFPIDFSEISITREISRDGTSRYFLNKSEILLRDLVDFLAKVRLGSRGLSVITQGNNDIIIKATPKERREMIEEILGLREYQLKKADAERRLRASEINLDKAKALMEEILPHLRSLKRQTSRWEKRDFLLSELKELENQFFGYEFQKLSEKIASLDQEIAAQRKEYQSFLAEKEKAEEHKRKVELSQPEENKQLKQIREKIREIFERKIILEKEISRLEAQMELMAKEDVRSMHSLEEALSFIKELKIRLEEIINDESKDVRVALRLIADDIKKFLSLEKVPRKEISQSIQDTIKKINEDLEIMGKEIQTFKEKEKILEKNQEEFYKFFKEAVQNVEIAREKIRRWEIENQARLIQRERIQTQLEEISHQIIQAGRRPEEFKNIKFELVSYDREAIERRIIRLRGELASMGEVDESLVKEAKETEARYEFLKKEVEDLEKAKKDLKKLISDLSEKINREFREAIIRINAEFNRLFNIMFGGGYAKFIVHPKLASKIKAKEELSEKNVFAEDQSRLTEEEKGGEINQEEGVEIEIKLPRKRIEGLEALSGGERSLVSIAALFALISVTPPPFLVVDEIDAALDERNAKRFADMLKEFSRKTQFIVITHNRVTMEAADVLYGVTLGEDGTSKILSLKLEK